MVDQIIGRVTSSKEEPSSANTFYFWVKDDVRVSLLDFVSVENIEDTKTIGIIKDLVYPTEADGHLTNYVSSDFGDITADPPSNVVGSCVAKVDILGNTGRKSRVSRTGKMQIWYPPKNFSNVRFATSDEIDEVLGLSQIPDEDKITAGLIVNSNDFIKPIYYHKKYLLGPEAGHLNVTGISGLATKTSYALFLLWLIFQKQKEDTCAILFNVKQRDLLYIDQPATDLDDIDKYLYQEMGIEDVKPFENVIYLFPRGKRQLDNVYSSDRPNCKEYSYTLEDVRDEIEFLFSEINDPQYTMASICEWIKNQRTIRNWVDLQNFDGYPKDVVGTSNRVGVIGKFQRHLKRLTGDSNIFVSQHSQNDTYVGKFIADHLIGGRIFVVDIQPFEKDRGIQGFVVGDVVNRILEKIDKLPSYNRPKNVIFFIDELNRYVPDKPGEPSALAEKIIELARVGRAEGITLFGAEQFMSEIDHQVYENCANNVIGKTGSTELSKQAYNFLDRETKIFVTRLQPGEMIVTNPLLSQPLKVIYPKPPYRRQS